MKVSATERDRELCECSVADSRQGVAFRLWGRRSVQHSTASGYTGTSLSAGGTPALYADVSSSKPGLEAG
jgi:hypothetical protein